MFLHPRMVGGGLEGEVEGQLQSEGLRLRDEPLEGLEITQVGVDGVVPAVERTDGPRGPRVVGGRVETVVLPLPEGRTDGMDRGQVGHVNNKVLKSAPVYALGKFNLITTQSGNDALYVLGRAGYHFANEDKKSSKIGRASCRERV